MIGEKSCPHIGIGRDLHKRLFISIFIPNKTVITLFQRFTSNEYQWAWGSLYMVPDELNGNNRLGDDHWIYMQKYIDFYFTNEIYEQRSKNPFSSSPNQDHMYLPHHHYLNL